MALLETVNLLDVRVQNECSDVVVHVCSCSFQHASALQNKVVGTVEVAILRAVADFFPSRSFRGKGRLGKNWLDSDSFVKELECPTLVLRIPQWPKRKPVLVPEAPVFTLV